MHIVITGGAGFLGARLARTILATGSLAVDGAQPRPVRRITLLDKVAPPADLTTDPRLRSVRGELADLVRPTNPGPGPDPGPDQSPKQNPDQGPDQGPDRDPDRGPNQRPNQHPNLGPDQGSGPLAAADVVFHLASAVSGECEADFDLGVEANLRAGYALFEACRALPTPPVLVFASSLAVYGNWPPEPVPEPVTDTTLPTPRSSYGIQKLILEQLVTDYTRKGFLVGRPVRLPTVTVRPGRPNAAASSFLSSIIREPLAGQRAACPVPPETPVALSSPDRAVTGLLRAAAVSTTDFGPPVGMNLPSVRTTVAGMVESLSTVAGTQAAARVDWVPDPAIEAIVASWPSTFETTRAKKLGLTADPDFTSIVRAYLTETGRP